MPFSYVRQCDRKERRARNARPMWVFPVPKPAVFSQRYERTSTLATSNLLLDRLTHHVHILEMNGDSFRLKSSRKQKDPGTH
jgi:hypothetical protein